MKDDKRFYIARLADDLQDGASERAVEVYEYAVLADADVVGELETDQFVFRVWEMGSFGNGQIRWLCLRMRYPIATEDERQQEYERRRQWTKSERANAFYHGGGPAEEVVALASIFFRRRLRLGQQVRMNDNPVMVNWDNNTNRLDEYRRGVVNTADAGDWFALLSKLDPKLHLSVMLAARLYQEALWQYETAPDLAYINLVTAVESLSNRASNEAATLATLDEQLSDLVGEISDDDLRLRITTHLEGRLRPDRVKARWVKFILDHVTPEFWTERVLPESVSTDATDKQLADAGYITPSTLERMIRKIYDQRSDSLHRGRPFPPFITDTIGGADVPPYALSMSYRGGSWNQDEFFPNLPFFERLVRNVIMSFVASNQLGPPTT